MSGAGGSERPEQWLEQRPRVFPPASPCPCVSGRSPPDEPPGASSLRGSSPPFPLTARLYPCKIILGAQSPPRNLLPKGPEPLSSGAQIPALGQDGVLQALVLGAEQCSDPGISEEQQRAQEEWEALEEIQSGLGGTSPVPPPPISFAEALQHFQSSGLSQSRRKVRGPGRRGGLAVLLRCLGGPPRLRPQLRGERELVLAMAQCALDDSERVHMRILQTIYRQLTRSRRGCPRYGTHWEELGFQGVDPGTDLRGTGMLGLMQILFFVLDSRMLPLAREIFQLSQHETQNFPFCIMSVNITRIVIQALREERLSRECNRRQQVIGVLNDLYAAAFLRLFRLWKRQCGTVADAGSFLKELELSTKKKPRQLLRSLEAYVSHSLRPSSPPSSSSQIHFTGICDPVVELEGDSRLI
ncbi:LOW QUALITY PROTEIN: ELMO domain-containing protein 3 [Neopelma chrysocephalum]|uniref:LOW QUALITY PROTEIN: ELMO domain-containing protein 3 n=1 Tax=Neopelma chrysocephalum TaxID=114329 RepID=UPI000FCCE27E|nr:LOW QUALITY PROTEIN: ELMO domain-containing protein 3 [Neopelma chrysocephalum]